MESERNEKPPDVKLPSPRSLSCKVVNSTELLSGDQPVVVITEEEAIHASLLNIMSERKKTALSCEIGWLFSGRLGPICVVLMDPTVSQGGHVKELLQILRPKALFWIVFGDRSDNIYLSGDIFICNEVYTNEGLQPCHRGLVKLMKGLKYGWNPPGSRDQFIHSGSGQLCDNHGNGEQVNCAVDIQMTSATDTFSCLRENQIPWTVVCGVLPRTDVEHISNTLQWQSYVAEILASFMKEVIDTEDIFAALDPSEVEKRIKSICLNAPSQEEDSTDSNIKSTLITEETISTKDGAAKTGETVELNESLQFKKYNVLPDIGGSTLPPKVPTASNEVIRQELKCARAELLHILSRVTNDARSDSLEKQQLQRDANKSIYMKVKEPEESTSRIVGESCCSLQAINSTPEDEALNRISLSEYREGQRPHERKLEEDAKISEGPLEVVGNANDTNPEYCGTNPGDNLRANSENRSSFRKEPHQLYFGKRTTVGEDDFAKPVSNVRYASASAVRSHPQGDRGFQHREPSHLQRPKSSSLSSRAKGI